jgi:homogentisate 1,2-dioxygenase
VPRQAHVAVPEGLLEDELGRKGVTGRFALLYRRHAPTEYTRIEGPLRPRLLSGHRLEPTDREDASGGPVKVFYNADLTGYISRRAAPMPHYFRNADGDEVHFVHEGRGVLQTEFGPLSYEPGDFLVIPKGTTYRVVPEAPSFVLIVETRGEVTAPDRGLLGQHAPFDTSVFVYPEPQVDEGDGRAEYEVRIKREDTLTRVYYPFCPLDVEGYKGTLCAFKFSVRDFRCLTSDRILLPPSAHTVFQAPGALFCLFAPRPLENDPEAQRLPWYHRNVDYDEIHFFHALARGPEAQGMREGFLQILPQGVHHGFPREVHEAARAHWKRGEVMDLYVLNIDAEKPVRLTEAAEAVELTAPPR